MKKIRFSIVLGSALLLISLFTFSAMAETLEWWMGTWQEKAATQLVQEFEEQNPGIKIKPSFIPWDGMHGKYLIALKTGNAPDILSIAVGWGYEWSKAGFLLPLDQFINNSSTDFGDWMAGAWNTGVIEDAVYGIPYRSDCIALFYNKDLFVKAGLDPEQPPQDWNQYLDYAIQLTKKVDGIYGSGLITAGEPLNLATRVLPFVYQNNGSILNNTKTEAVINQKPAVDAIKWVTELYTKYQVEPKSNIQNDAESIMELFKEGKIAMVMGGQYNIPQVLNQTEINLGTALLPKNPTTGKRTVLMGGWNLTITKDAENPESAFKFIEFLSRADNMARLTIALPARAAAYKSQYINKKYETDPLYLVNKEQLNYGILINIPYKQQAKTIIAEEIQNILIGRKEVQKAMDDAAVRIEEIINR